MAKKIVVTGVGAFSPLGSNVDETWRELLNGTSGVRSIDAPWIKEFDDLPVTFAASVAGDPADHLTRQEIKRLDPSSQFALIAAREAWQSAGSPEPVPERLVVDWATGIGGVWTLLNAWDTQKERGSRRVLPMTVPMLMPNAPAAAVGMEFHARGGVRTAVSACASSTESIANAYRHLRDGDADIVIAGGSEAAIHPITIAAFGNMQALSKRNDEPAHASRPYDVDRDGFVMGEGAAALVLETEEHAKARGATILAELIGGGVSNDSYHITAGHPEGVGAARAIESALAEAGVSADAVTHINAHATSTPVGDIAEYRAFVRMFGERTREIPVSATKSMTGHLLGGAGALEAVFCVLALQNRLAPPTINLENPDPEIQLSVSDRPQQLPDGENVAISTSFGFGGSNAVIALRSVS